jgi:hypothetical protein
MLQSNIRFDQDISEELWDHLKMNKQGLQNYKKTLGEIPVKPGPKGPRNVRRPGGRFSCRERRPWTARRGRGLRRHCGPKQSAWPPHRPDDAHAHIRARTSRSRRRHGRMFVSPFCPLAAQVGGPRRRSGVSAAGGPGLGSRMRARGAGGSPEPDSELPLDRRPPPRPPRPPRPPQTPPQTPLQPPPQPLLLRRPRPPPLPPPRRRREVVGAPSSPSAGRPGGLLAAGRRPVVRLGASALARGRARLPGKRRSNCCRRRAPHHTPLVGRGAAAEGVPGAAAAGIKSVGSNRSGPGGPTRPG